MPLGFEKVPGEVGVYCERGDVMLHHSWTCGAAPPAQPRTPRSGCAVTSEEPSWVVRRLAPDERLEAFNKNAAR